MQKYIRVLALILSMMLLLGVFAGCNKTEPTPIIPGLEYPTFQEYMDNSIHLHPEKDDFLRYALYDKFVQVIECVSDAEEIVIPDEYKGKPVIGIRDEAFIGRTSLKKVVIGQNILQIGERAFSDCTALKQVKMSRSVNEIKAGAFQYCSALQSIIIPPKVMLIEGDTFSGCTSLRKVIIESFDKTDTEEETKEETVRTIEGSAFYECNSLGAMWIPDDIGEIDEAVFGGSPIKPLICGGDSTASAYLAILKCFDYEVVSREEFDTYARLQQIDNSALKTKIGTSMKNGEMSVKLTAVNKYKSLGNVQAAENKVLLVASFEISHTAMIPQYFNGLNVKCVSHAPGMDNTMEDFTKQPIMLATSVLGQPYPVGTVLPGEKMTGIIVLEVSERFDYATIEFSGFGMPFVV